MKGWIEGRKLIVSPLSRKKCFFRPRKLCASNIGDVAEKNLTERRLTLFDKNENSRKSCRTKIDKLTFLLSPACIRVCHMKSLEIYLAFVRRDARLMATVSLL